MMDESKIETLPVAVVAILWRNLPSDLKAGVTRLLGPVADEVAQLFSDKVHVYRFLSAAKAFRRAYEKLDAACITPNSVLPKKLLYPLPEGTPYEEHESDLRRNVRLQEGIES